MSKLAATAALAVVLIPAVYAGPAGADDADKTTTNCSPGQVNTAIPTPTAATSVTAAKYGAIKGKAKVTWSQSNQRYPNPYTLYFRVLTSDGRCTSSKEYKTGGTCLEFKKGSTWACKMKRLPSGSTEFQVALWYQDATGAAGPVTISAWSNAVNVK
ncbi:MAG: hypothetical protein FJW85_07335 [Actinobacteria bacterium]|nr:hypothetical protein [Actinomycetota bacterium]